MLLLTSALHGPYAGGSGSSNLSSQSGCEPASTRLTTVLLLIEPHHAHSGDLCQSDSGRPTTRAQTKNTFRLLFTHFHEALRQEALLYIAMMLLIALAALWTPLAAHAQAAGDSATTPATIGAPSRGALSVPFVISVHDSEHQRRIGAGLCTSTSIVQEHGACTRIGPPSAVVIGNPGTVQGTVAIAQCRCAANGSVSVGRIDTGNIVVQPVCGSRIERCVAACEPHKLRLGPCTALLPIGRFVGE